MMESMLSRMKNKVISIVAPDLPALPATNSHHPSNSRVLPEKFTYARPGMFDL